MDVVISMEGDLSVAVLEYQGEVRLGRMPFNLALMYRVRLVPKGDHSGVIVVVDDILKGQLAAKASELGMSHEKMKQEIAMEAIGRHLDEEGMPEFTPSGTPAVLIAGTDVAQRYFERKRARSPDDETLLAYIARKVYWGWAHGAIETTLRPADARRLGTTVLDLVRVAIAGDGVYWQREDAHSPVLRPASRLLRDVPSGAFPGLERPILPRVANLLSAPRYAAAKKHFTRAMELLDQDSPDLANAVKEAASAVESMSLVVLDREKGTLGDCIKDLRGRGILKPPLLKALEALWGFASEEPGIRHGKTAAEDVPLGEATFALSLAGSAIVLLLELDR